MKRTTVYLNEDELEGLRRAAAASGRSQAELIREGVRRVVFETPTRRFHSMAKGHGPGDAAPRWKPDELYQRVVGKDTKA